MMIPEQYHCDSPGCKAVHTETNHWWGVVYYNERHEIAVRPWENCTPFFLASGKHFCGQSHALQYLSSIMGESKDAAP